MNVRIGEKIEKWMSGPNEQAIIRYIIKNEKASRTGISKALAVSMSTVTNVTEKLIKKNLIREAGLVKTDRGRSIRLLEVNKEKFKSIGIGVNSLCISISLIDLSGKKYFHNELPLNTTNWDANYTAIITSVHRLLDENSDSCDDILGIGIEPPGFIEYEMENLDDRFDYEDEWSIDTLTTMLESTFDYGVKYYSSFSCILCGEAYFGNARRYNNIININISSAGLGWARIENKIIDRGIAESYRSIGHMVININGPECACSQHGCVELYTGKEALVDNYKRLALLDNEYSGANGNLDDLSYHKVLEYAENGDYIAVQSVSKAATLLGIALGNMASMMHPDMIILTGKIIRESNLYFEIAKKTILGKIKTLGEREVVVEHTAIHNAGSTSVGAATLVFEQIFLDE